MDRTPEIDRLNSIKQRLERELEEARGQIGALQDQQRDALRAAQDAKAAIRELEFQIETLERNNTRLEDDVGKERGRTSQVEDRYRAEQDAHQQDVRQKVDELADAQREIRRLKEEIESLRRQLAEASGMNTSQIQVCYRTCYPCGMAIFWGAAGSVLRFLVCVAVACVLLCIGGDETGMHWMLSVGCLLCVRRQGLR